MNKYATEFPRNAIPVGPAKDGTLVYKDRLNEEYRIIFTPIKNDDKGGVKQIVIYDIVFEHDQQPKKIELAFTYERLYLKHCMNLVR